MSGAKNKLIDSLGVLLWSVVQADGNVEEKEITKMRQYFKELHLDNETIERLLVYTKELEKERIDIYRFVREIAKDMDYAYKVSLIKKLFEVAFSTKNLAIEELEIIRKIANIFYISHKDFIQAKLNAQREAGLKTLDF